MTLQVDFSHSVTFGMPQKRQLVNVLVNNSATVPVIEQIQQQTPRAYTRT
jgi:hypothetical protein